MGGGGEDVRHRGERGAAVAVKVPDGEREVGEQVRRQAAGLAAAAAVRRVRGAPVQRRHELSVALSVLQRPACRVEHVGGGHAWGVSARAGPGGGGAGDASRADGDQGCDL